MGLDTYMTQSSESYHMSQNPPINSLRHLQFLWYAWVCRTSNLPWSCSFIPGKKDWRDDSEIKSIWCLCRDPVPRLFSSQHSHDGSHPLVTSTSGDMALYTSRYPARHEAVHINIGMQAKYSCTKINESKQKSKVISQWACFQFSPQYVYPGWHWQSTEDVRIDIKTLTSLHTSIYTVSQPLLIFSLISCKF